MFKLKIKKLDNPEVRWLFINDGHINIETGIKFVYELADEDMNTVEKKLFIINGDDFDDLGLSSLGIRLEILKYVLQHCNAEVIN